MKRRNSGADPFQATKMADIARLAGVAESTVSRALAGSALVNGETRARIAAIARDHGYEVDQAARNLRLQRTGTIAVVFPLMHKVDRGISDPFFLEMLGHLADAISDRHYDLLLRKLGPDDPDGLATLIRQKRADGLIVIGQSTQHPHLNDAAKNFSPLVVWGAELPGSRYTTVGSDNFGGGRLAARHLLGLGRTRIVFIGDPALPEVAARCAGFRAELKDAGVPARRALICRASFESAEAPVAIGRFLAQHPDIDGVFAASDLLAMAAINCLAQAGRRVPDQVSVVGFDDILAAAACSPPLTTVRQNIAEGARSLVDMLLVKMGGAAAASRVLQTDLIVRASSRHAAALTSG